MVQLTVLVTAASRRVPLVRAFRRALHDLGAKGRVIACDVNAWSPAVYVADAAFEVPLSSDPAYVDTVLRLCRAEGVGLVVPTIDDELPIFGRQAHRFRSEGVTVAVSPIRTTEICNDKHATCGHLLSHGISAARSWLPSRLPMRPRFPLFVKPRFGRGSVGAFRADNARQLAFFLEYVARPVVQEYLTGPEFTIDLFCDFAGRPISAVPRERVVIRAGVIDRGRTLNDPTLLRLALDCASAFEFTGAINIQCRVVDGLPTIFEINPRFSGGIPLTIAAGADFPRWLLELTLGRTVEPAIGQFDDRLWMTSFETALFLDEHEQRVLQPVPAPGATELPASA